MDDWDWKAILFSFKGRLNRAKYWLINILSNLVGSFALALTTGLMEKSGGASNPAFWIGFVASLSLAFVFIWIVLAMIVKRLHDRGKSGWWLLAFFGPPLAVGTLASADPSLNWFAFPVVIGFVVWAIVELGCLKGTAGPNAYGPDPIPAEAEQGS